MQESRSDSIVFTVLNTIMANRLGALSHTQVEKRCDNEEER